MINIGRFEWVQPLRTGFLLGTAQTGPRDNNNTSPQNNSLGRGKELVLTRYLLLMSNQMYNRIKSHAMLHNNWVNQTPYF